MAGLPPSLGLDREQRERERERERERKREEGGRVRERKRERERGEGRERGRGRRRERERERERESGAYFLLASWIGIHLQKLCLLKFSRNKCGYIYIYSPSNLLISKSCFHEVFLENCVPKKIAIQY